jgi:hypothetical protein
VTGQAAGVGTEEDVEDVVDVVDEDDVEDSDEEDDEPLSLLDADSLVLGSLDPLAWLRLSVR